MNRLASATSGGLPTTYGYAGMVRRTATTGSVVKLYEVDEAGRRLGEYVKDASQPSGWRAVQEFVYLDAHRIVGLVDYAPTGAMNALLAVLSDPITGTPRQVMDADGDIRWDWDAKEPFGNQAPHEAPTVGKAALVFDARFPGQWYDEASGLFHNNWREYWPRVGRYTQVDPIGLAGGENPYAYVMGNPVGAVDPEGLKIVYLDEASKIAVEKLRSSPVARNIISSAERSAATLYIDADFRVFPKLVEPNKLFGYGRPTVAYWNPRLDLYCGEEIVVPSEVTLFHEIYHFVQSQDKELSEYLSIPMNRKDAHRWTDRREKDAILLENSVSRHFGYRGRYSHNLRDFGYSFGPKTGGGF